MVAWGAVQIAVHDEVGSFARDVSAFLLEDETTNNLILSVLRDLLDGRYPDLTPLLVKGANASEPVVVACQTPPFGLLVSHCRDAGVWPSLARALADRTVPLPSVLGRAAEASEFASAWCDVTGASSRISQRSRLFRLAAVRTPSTLRNRVFGTALVASLSQAVLNDGLDFCFLFADVANPAANRLYEKVGYRPVSDQTLYSFRSTTLA